MDLVEEFLKKGGKVHKCKSGTPKDLLQMKYKGQLWSSKMRGGISPNEPGYKTYSKMKTNLK